LLPRPVGPYLPLLGQLARVHEHGHAGHAARLKDS
jgi:hypothetical protein